jgi:ubiquinone/menaquinone biosynthesis C-methylase UbiE
MSGNDVVIEAFTELAPRYVETVDRELRQFWGLSYEKFVDRLIEVAPVNEGDVVLDVATGTALIPLKLVDNVGDKGRVVGLDITPAMLKHGRKNVEAAGSSSRINLVCASAMAMPFVEGVFDIVICGLGMHHMDVSQVLFEMKRVLKEGGHFIIACVGVPAFWRSFWGNALIKTMALLYKVTHRSARAQAEVAAVLNIHTAGEWHTILSDFGFTKIEITAVCQTHRFWHPDALTLRAVKSVSFS